MSESRPTREARTFKLDDTDSVQLTPESLTASAETAAVEHDWSQYPSPPRYARIFGLSLIALVAMILSYDLAQIIQSLWSLHWGIGALAGLVLTLLCSTLGYSAWQWLFGPDQARQLAEVRQLLESARAAGTSSTSADALMDQLKRCYERTPLNARVEQFVEESPDYLQASEVADRFEHAVIQPIDERVEALIRGHAVQTGVVIAASPFPALDLMLTLWRNFRMVGDISAHYGLRPNLSNRMKISYKVLQHLAFTGGTEALMDRLDLTDLPLINVGGRVSQGVGSALATARIGMVTADLCRPVKPRSEDSSWFKSFTRTLAFMLGKKLSS